MRQDRHSLYRRGSIWHVQFYSLHTLTAGDARDEGPSLGEVRGDLLPVPAFEAGAPARGTW